MKPSFYNKRTRKVLHNVLMNATIVLVLLIASFFTLAQPSFAAVKSQYVTMEQQPWGTAVNPQSNKIYVINSNDDSVTIIDGADNNKTEVVTVGESPTAIAVNSITNKIYVVNRLSDSVTVIDGITNETREVAVGGTPVDLVVNAVTNKIYVVNQGVFNQGGDAADGTYIKNSGGVTVIDGATNKTTTIATQSNPFALAVNVITNKIYVVNTDLVYNAAGDYVKGSGKITVIDGVTNKLKSVSVERGPLAVAVNSVTNKIYVANSESKSVTVIDGVSNKTSTVKVGSTPIDIEVNSATNKIYVVNTYSHNVTVIDGATNKTSTVKVGNRPYAAAVNPVTNKIYVLNGNHFDKARKVVYDLTIIDGTSNKTTTLAMKGTGMSASVNSVTNKIYVSLPDEKIINIIDDTGRIANQLIVSITPSTEKNDNVKLQFHATNMSSSATPTIQSIYYQIDSMEGEWIPASRSGKEWAANVTLLTSGEHTIYVWALETHENGTPKGRITYRPLTK